MNTAFAKAYTVLNRLLRGENSQSGVAMIELAYSLPIFITLGLTGTELSNLAVTNMQLSQIAMSITDNLSRAKQTVALGAPQFREHDVNDAFLGAGLQAGTLRLFQNGRVVVSSLQRNTAGGQWIAWQRCRGARTAVSLYGTEGTGATGTAYTGMGPATKRVVAEPSMAVIVTEVTYTYQPLVASAIFGPITLRQEAAYYVRDDRNMTGGPDNNGVFNPTPASFKRTCNLYSAT